MAKLLHLRHTMGGIERGFRSILAGNVWTRPRDWGESMGNKVSLFDKIIGASIAIALCAPINAAVLEEVVVTAQKREENLQDISIAVTAFSADDMAALNMDNLQSVSFQTPGFYVKNQFSTEGMVMTMRGVGTNDASTVNSPTVSVYIDQVSLPYHMMLGFQLLDLERVEILKGPQGTLYGRNNTGGAVNFITKKPSQEFGGFGRVDYGTFKTLEVETAVGGGLTEDLSGRIAFKTTQRYKGHQRNRASDANGNGPGTGPGAWGELDQMAVRGQLLWEPTENFDALLRLTAGKHDDEQFQLEHHGTQDPAAQIAFGFGVPGGPLCAPGLAGRRDEGPCTDVFLYFDPDDDPNTGDWNSEWINQGANLHSLFTSLGAGLTMNWEFDRFTVTSVTGWDRLSRDSTEDSDQSPFIALEAGFFEDIDSVSQEIRITSDDSWPVEWIVGFFYSTDEITGDVVFLATDSLFTNTQHQYVHDTESYAGFAHFTWPFHDQFRFKGGIRVTHETRDMDQTVFDLNPLGVSLLSPVAPRVPVPGGPPLNFLCFIGAIPPPCAGPLAPIFGTNTLVDQVAGIDVTDISGDVGIEWLPTDDIMAYAKFSKGFKSGGFNSLVVFAPGDAQPFTEETIFSYEGGIKATLLDNTLRVNFAMFYSEWNDFQAQIGQPGGDFPVANAGDAEIFGFEGELFWVPLDGLDLRFGIGYLDAEVVRSNPDLAFDLKGNRVHSTSEWVFNTLARYSFPIPVWNLTGHLQMDAYWQDDQFYEVKNTPPIFEQPYWLLNARVSVTSADERWELAIWGKNLTETIYASENFDFTGVNGTGLRVPGFPRTAGLSIAYSWE